jgi:3-oxoacyl-[acyl-carrier protein] reductase
VIDPGLEGRVALVTGGNHGIGAASAMALGAQGARVLISYLRLDPAEHAGDPSTPEAYGAMRAETADSVVAAIRASGGGAEAQEADLVDPASPAALFDAAEAAFGPVEILVNNAAAWQGDTFVVERAGEGDAGAPGDRFGRRLTRVSADTHDRHFLVNSRATALLIAEFARRHIARRADWGRIVSLTTGTSPGFPEEVSYGASKNALDSYTVSAGVELAPFGVTANILCPPPTDTGWVTEVVAEEVVASSPFGHVGRPEEVAEVIVFLASHQARWITGEKITMR